MKWCRGHNAVLPTLFHFCSWLLMLFCRPIPHKSNRRDVFRMQASYHLRHLSPPTPSPPLSLLFSFWLGGGWLVKSVDKTFYFVCTFSDVPHFNIASFYAFGNLAKKYIHPVKNLSLFAFVVFHIVYNYC